MTHFSAKKAIEFSFSTYRKHLVLLVIASAAIAGSLWVCSGHLERIAQQSGIDRALDIVAIAKEQGHPATAWSVIAQVITNLKTIPAHYYIAILLVAVFGYVLFFFLIVGFMNLCLALKDTGHGSLKLLFSSSFVQVKRFVGSAVLYFLSTFIGFVGAALAVVPMTMLCKLFLSNKITTILSAAVCLCLMLAVVVWVMGYGFFGFCILDKSQIGSLEALRMSAALSKGHRGRIVKTLLMIFLVVIIPLLILLAVVATVAQTFSWGDYATGALLNSASAMVTYPLFFLCGSYLYRSLNPKQSA